MDDLLNKKSLYKQKTKINSEIERLYKAQEYINDFKKSKQLQEKIIKLQKELKRIEFKEKIGGIL